MVSDITKSNLGYYAGYYDEETRIRVEKMFQCVHPVFGQYTKNKLTSEQVFEMGRRRGLRMLRKKKINKIFYDRTI